MFLGTLLSILGLLTFVFLVIFVILWAKNGETPLEVTSNVDNMPFKIGDSKDSDSEKPSEDDDNDSKGDEEPEADLRAKKTNESTLDKKPGEKSDEMIKLKSENAGFAEDSEKSKLRTAEKPLVEQNRLLEDSFGSKPTLENYLYNPNGVLSDFAGSSALKSDLSSLNKLDLKPESASGDRIKKWTSLPQDSGLKPEVSSENIGNTLDSSPDSNLKAESPAQNLANKTALSKGSNLKKNSSSKTASARSETDKNSQLKSENTSKHKSKSLSGKSGLKSKETEKDATLKPKSSTQKLGTNLNALKEDITSKTDALRKGAHLRNKTSLAEKTEPATKKHASLSETKSNNLKKEKTANKSSNKEKLAPSSKKSDVKKEISEEKATKSNKLTPSSQKGKGSLEKNSSAKTSLKGNKSSEKKSSLKTEARVKPEKQLLLDTLPSLDGLKSDNMTSSGLLGGKLGGNGDVQTFNGFSKLTDSFTDVNNDQKMDASQLAQNMGVPVNFNTQEGEKLLSNQDQMLEEVGHKAAALKDDAEAQGEIENSKSYLSDKPTKKTSKSNMVTEKEKGESTKKVHEHHKEEDDTHHKDEAKKEEDPKKSGFKSAKKSKKSNLKNEKKSKISEGKKSNLLADKILTK